MKEFSYSAIISAIMTGAFAPLVSICQMWTGKTV